MQVVSCQLSVVSGKNQDFQSNHWQFLVRAGLAVKKLSKQHHPPQNPPLQPTFRTLNCHTTNFWGLVTGDWVEEFPYLNVLKITNCSL
ncbi:hypothetical protein [Argonema antarcticum]|uniref:hypothetical protein n=1 Tax=Argonema antarcticum TaxID=2942763 RepID=UPI002012843C|nr:hypothetical protein [Argonema antarcticum]MCL1470415.1 hypothetical protein [Argonema antarcticum A004/B2]